MIQTDAVLPVMILQKRRFIVSHHHSLRLQTYNAFCFWDICKSLHGLPEVSPPDLTFYDDKDINIIQPRRFRFAQRLGYSDVSLASPVSIRSPGHIIACLCWRASILYAGPLLWFSQNFPPLPGWAIVACSTKCVIPLSKCEVHLLLQSSLINTVSPEYTQLPEDNSCSIKSLAPIAVVFL